MLLTLWVVLSLVRLAWVGVLVSVLKRLLGLLMVSVLLLIWLWYRITLGFCGRWSAVEVWTGTVGCSVCVP